MTRVVLRLCGVAAAIALVAGVSTAKASLIVGGRCASWGQPFAQFGDYRSYAFAPDGGLENGGLGWTFSNGARVVAGNESYYVHDENDRRSLSLPPGSAALTPSMCMGTSSTVVRFFDRSGTSGSLRVQVVERNLLGAVVGVLDWTTIDAGTEWAPSPAVLNLDCLLGVVGVSSVQLRFTPLDGSAQVDDVYIDPWSSGD